MRTATILGLTALCLGGAPGAWAAYGARVDVSTEYRAQWAQQHAGGELRDQDLTVGLGVDAPKVGVRGVSFSGLLHYDADLDGTAEDSPFKDILDSYSRRDDFRLYRAALSYDLPDGWLRLTAGRQEVWSAETATLDGGLARLTPCRWFGLEVFGGQRVSFYKDPEPDGVYGANLDLRPFRTTLLQLKDLYYIDNSFQASVIQQLWGWGSGRVVYRMIDDEARDASLALHLYPWAEAEAHLTYLRTFGNDFDYDYTSAEDDRVSHLPLEPLEAYSDASATFRQGFFGVVGVGARVRHHNVIDEADEDTTNVDFDEGSLLFDLSEWPWAGLRIDAEGTRWVEDRDRADVTEDSLWGFSVQVQQSLRGHAIGGGVHRQAYDSDGAPRDSRAFDVWVRVKVLEMAALHLRYEREVDDLYRQEGIDALHVATARLDLTF